MSTSSQVTEAHRNTVDAIRMEEDKAYEAWNLSRKEAAQLVADSEARALNELAEVARGVADHNVDLRLENDQLRAECKNKTESIQIAADKIDELKKRAEHWCDMHTVAAKERDQSIAELARLKSVSPDKSCGELSRDECNARTAALIEENGQLRAQVALDEKAKAAMLREHYAYLDTITQLRVEVKRLKTLAGATDVIREWCKKHDEGLSVVGAYGLWQTRAERTEAELAKVEKAYIAEVQRRFNDVDALAAKLAKERARLDWLEDSNRCYHVCIDRQPDGYSIHNSPPSRGSVRAAIDAAMKEDSQ